MARDHRRDDLGRLRDRRDRVPRPVGGDERDAARRVSGGGPARGGGVRSSARSICWRPSSGSTRSELSPAEPDPARRVPLPDGGGDRVRLGATTRWRSIARSSWPTIPALRAEQADRRARGDRTAMGIGLATYVEITGFPTKEFARVDIETDGTATAYVGTTSFGQGHETAFAQLVGGMLAIALHRRPGRAFRHRARRARAGVVGIAVAAGGRVGARSRGPARSSTGRATLAAAALEVDPVDLEGPVDGGFRVLGAPERSIGWRELAARADAPTAAPLSAKGVSPDPGRHVPVRRARRRRRRGPRDRGRRG